MANTPLMHGAPGCNCCTGTCHATLCVSGLYCPCWGCDGAAATLSISGPGGTWTEADWTGPDPNPYTCNRCVTIPSTAFGAYAVAATDGNGHSKTATVSVDSCGTHSVVLDFADGFHVPPSALNLTLPDGSTHVMAVGGCGSIGPLANFFCFGDTWTDPYGTFGPVDFQFAYDYCSGNFSVCVAYGGGFSRTRDGISADNPTAPGPCENPLAKAPHVHPLTYTAVPDFDSTRNSLCGPSTIDYPNSGNAASGMLVRRFGPGPWDFLVDG